MTANRQYPLRVGIGGPVGSGKTALIDMLCRHMRDRYEIAVITNDIYTREDAEFLMRSGALSTERIMGVETGGCPHTAIREDASINMEAIRSMYARFPGLELVFVESGGDNLAATFSPELVDITIYVIDVAAGDKIPRKGGPGIIMSDLLVINKMDLAPLVGADLEVMAADTQPMRSHHPLVLTHLQLGPRLPPLVSSLQMSLHPHPLPPSPPQPPTPPPRSRDGSTASESSSLLDDVSEVGEVSCSFAW